MGVRFTQIRDMVIFQHKHFTRYSVAMRLRCVKNFNYSSDRYLLLSLSVKVFWNQFACGKVSGKSRVTPFSDTVYYNLVSYITSCYLVVENHS